MKFKELGHTGVLIPEAGIGTWDYHAGPGPLRAAIEAGAWFIDTAESYGTESVVGEAIAGIRDTVFVATKASPANFRRAALHRSVENSLKRLGTEVVDLLQLHEPNPDIPIAETMDALGELIDAGKVRFAGVSNFSVAQLRETQQALGRHPVVSNQVRYNMVDRTIERDLLAYCQANHITVIAYSPLSRGLGRIRDCDPTGVIDEIARAAGRSPAQIALAWCLAKRNVVVIPGSNSPEHLLDNCAASGFHLSEAQLAELNSRIRFRQRNRFDALVRRRLPGPLKAAALRLANALPRRLRRRVL